MGLSRIVSEIDDDFSRKSKHFPTPVYFTSPLTGLLGTGYWHKGQKIRMMELPDGQTDNQQDGHLMTAKTGLCRALHG